VSEERTLNLEVSKDALTGGIQLSINDVDSEGVGHGYRIAGPKFSGDGKILMTADLDTETRREIRRYLDVADRRDPLS